MESIPTSEPLMKQSFTSWHRGEPNGERLENCATLGHSGKWYDHSCASKHCVTCQLPKTPVFVMRGKSELELISNWYHHLNSCTTYIPSIPTHSCLM